MMMRSLYSVTSQTFRSRSLPQHPAAILVWLSKWSVGSRWAAEVSLTCSAALQMCLGRGNRVATRRLYSAAIGRSITLSRWEIPKLHNHLIDYSESMLRPPKWIPITSPEISWSFPECHHEVANDDANIITVTMITSPGAYWQCGCSLKVLSTGFL